MLFAELGYTSLFDFCVKHLGLSEGSAQRRIAAMRLVRDLPEAREALTSGELSLSNAAKLQSVFRAQRRIDGVALAPAEMRSVLADVAGTSQRECERKLAVLLPEATEACRPREREEANMAGELELTLRIPPDLRDKLRRLQELLSHALSPGGSTVELLERLADQEIARLEKKAGLSVSQPATADTATAPIASTAAAVRTKTLPSDIDRLSASRRREVFRRAGGKCEFPGCGSRFRLEIDHRVPRAFGGTHAAANLRLLCRTHNLHQARMRLGEMKMRRYVRSLRD
jgi:hypothetical protein